MKSFYALLCATHSSTSCTDTHVHRHHVFLFYSLCACVCPCARDSLLLYSLSLWVCMRTSRCRRRSLQPHSLQSSFDCTSALCPANPKTSVVFQSHTLTQTYVDIHNSPRTHTLQLILEDPFAFDSLYLSAFLCCISFFFHCCSFSENPHIKRNHLSFRCQKNLKINFGRPFHPKRPHNQS